MENWKDVPEYGGRYQVSDCGGVSGPSGPLRPWRSGKAGYRIIGLWLHGKERRFAVHRLVLTAFTGPCPEGMECRHLDGDPANNHIENLAWGTKRENEDDKDRHGTSWRSGWRPPKMPRGAPTFTDAVLRRAVEARINGASQKEVAAQFSMSASLLDQVERKRVRPSATDGLPVPRKAWRPRPGYAVAKPKPGT